MSTSVDSPSRGGNGTPPGNPKEGNMTGNGNKTEPIEKLEDVLVEGPSQAGEIVSPPTPDQPPEKSVEQALEDFVAQANSAFTEDYDGWDIAANIDKFVEQARTKPVEETAAPPPPAAPARVPTPLPAPAAAGRPSPRPAWCAPARRTYRCWPRCPSHRSPR